MSLPSRVTHLTRRSRRPRRVTWILFAIFGSFLAFVMCPAPSLVFAQRPEPIVLRFHHLHYRVADPGAVLQPVAAELKGTRAIVQGVGVGVRVGREYVLFDRAEQEQRESMGSASRTPDDAYREAARWLTSRGLRVQPASLGETSLRGPLTSLDAPSAASLDHVAFAADDLAPVVAKLERKPVSKPGDAARFKLDSGLVVEIVRDTDRPDAYWCPMHPDVRSPAVGRCPRCKMALVPIPAPKIGEYRLDVTTQPHANGGITGLRLVVRDPESNDPVSTFVEVHEQPFHLFIVSRDLSQFAHVHPERKEDGAFELHHDLAPGLYMLIADFLPAGGTPQMVQRAIVTPGYSGPLFAAAPGLDEAPREQTAGGVRIRMDAPSAAARKETLLSFHVSDEKSGFPVTDLEPYLGASGHLFIVNQDVTDAVHAHPEGASTQGPIVTFGAVFPAPGRYKLWVQFQRRQRIVTAPFVVIVP